MRHSQVATYLAIMSPKPDQSMRMGALATMSVSAMMATGQWLYNVVFTSFTCMEEEEEA